MVVDRPACDPDSHWSETGDQYLLKLFHDFVLHHVTEDGAPMIDKGHVIEALNKLDAGVPESAAAEPNEASTLVVFIYQHQALHGDNLCGAQVPGFIHARPSDTPRPQTAA
ncbi:hypothetical protein WJX84_001441 [Apatococcus fuscideae]|uniref:Pan3 C-terminal knob domain-containing protein n=1 Tax=Apatococcus fuscideae TaxID=2026836 RepID=A0AAW1T322_9CHLO